MEQAYNVASMPMGSDQSTQKTKLPTFSEISQQCLSVYLAIYVLDLARAALRRSKQED